MDDDGTSIACGFENLIEARSELFESPYGVQTMVIVPDVAHDQRGLRGSPRLFLDDLSWFVGRGRIFLNGLQFELDVIGHCDLCMD